MTPPPPGPSTNGVASGATVPNARSGGPTAHQELSPLVTKPTDFTMSTIPEESPAQPGSLTSPTPGASTLTPAPPLRKADTDLTWGAPIGAPIRGVHDEQLRIFRTAVGINAHVHCNSSHRAIGKENTIPIHEPRGPYGCAPDLESGRKAATGIYAEILKRIWTRNMQHSVLDILLYALYFGQILIAAALTALGPGAKDHPMAITILGACNTVIAGVLALIKGQGLPERLRNDEIEFRRLRDWIEETEALLAVGVIGRDRRDVGVLVETAFRKYNAAKQSEDDNKPDAYVSARVPEDDANRIRNMK